MLAIAQLWDQVTCDTFKDCGRCTAILPQTTKPDNEDPFDAISLAELKSLLAKGSFPTSDCAAQAYADVNSTEDVAKALSDDGILELVSPAGETNGDAPLDKGSKELCELLPVNAKEASEVLRMAVQFFEQ